MPLHDRAPSGAIFDVKPVDESGLLDVQKISAVQRVVNLTAFRPKKEIKKRIIDPAFRPNPKPASGPIKKPAHLLPPSEEALPPVMDLPSEHSIKEEFEELMNHNLDLSLELAKIGVTANQNLQAKPRYRVIRSSTSLAESDQYTSLISTIHHSAMNIARKEYSNPNIESEPPIVEPTLASMPLELSPAAETEVRSFFSTPTVSLISHRRSSVRRQHFRIPLRFILGAAIVLTVLGLLVRYGFRLKHQIVDQSSAAVTSLQTAHDDLKQLDFKNASQDFFSAYANFSHAGDSLNIFGASITDIISGLPGAGTLKSAKNLLQVGQLLSAAGTSMTTALNAVSKTGALADPTNPSIPLGPIVSALKKALLASQQEVAQASSLMADIDSSIIPADKQSGFLDFKAKLPELETAMNMSADYAKFFENLITTSGSQRYLIMFQNGSELRPTGGFPGTYGVVSFTNGKLESVFVDDVYNLDGQLKEHIIPPLQMQHITPSWGMRDANWYVDFPMSARNIVKFYKKESGQSVDGVIMVNPEMISKILDIVGPIEMLQYNLTLTSENVLTTIQSQVEYGTNRTQPKQIVKDFAPLLLAKMYAAGSDKWLAIFNTFVLSMNQHDVLMYFNNLSLESFVTDKGFGGQVKQPDGDYLMATVTNIKGSKTDAVTDTSFTLDTAFQNDSAVHTLTVTRTHNGGSAKYGFYNKQNPAYVRVLVPDGAELVSVTGNDQPNFTPLINYAKSGFVRDDNLAAFETSGKTDNTTGVTTYRESGKTEFGFWLITDPGKSKTVTVRYQVPKVLKDKTYQLYVQKQPALKIKNFTFSMQKPDGLTPDASAPVLTRSGSEYSYSLSLENDLAIKVNFK